MLDSFLFFQPSFQGFPHKNLREKPSMMRLRHLPVFPRAFSTKCMMQVKYNATDWEQLGEEYPDTLYHRVTAHGTIGQWSGTIETATNVSTIQQHHISLIEKNHKSNTQE